VPTPTLKLVYSTKSLNSVTPPKPLKASLPTSWTPYRLIGKILMLARQQPQAAADVERMVDELLKGPVT